MCKKQKLSTFIIMFILLNVITSIKTYAAEIYKPTIPDGFSEIKWVNAVGINSYFKIPKDNGTIDYITKIYLPNNEISFIFQGTPTSLGKTGINKLSDLAPFSDEKIPANENINNYENLSFTRFVAEDGKSIDPKIKFIWDAQFFNMKTATSDLSMSIKYTINGKTTINSGSRSVIDLSRDRKMLIIDNNSGKAEIKKFDQAYFIKNGDQALEGFASTVDKGDGATARLFIGVSNDGKELIIYCSQLASIKEASDALVLAGASVENQLQADGGGSAVCGYNLPGQYFVEPTRTLPILMGAKSFLLRGKISETLVNVRDSASLKGKVVNKLSKNTQVIVYEEKDNWYRIGDGQWVLKSLIK